MKEMRGKGTECDCGRVFRRDSFQQDDKLNKNEYQLVGGAFQAEGLEGKCKGPRIRYGWTCSGHTKEASVSSVL